LSGADEDPSERELGEPPTIRIVFSLFRVPSTIKSHFAREPAARTFYRRERLHRAIGDYSGGNRGGADRGGAARTRRDSSVELYAHAKVLDAL